MTKVKLDTPKKIVFFRHGHALSLTEAKVTTDSQRPLSDKGRQDVKLSAQKLAKLNIPFDIILTSPYERAQNSAKIIFEMLKIPMLVDKNLISGTPEIQIWSSILGKLKNYNGVIIVGHQPYLGAISGRLLTGASIPLDAAGFIVLEFKRYLPMHITQGFAKEIKEI